MTKQTAHNTKNTPVPTFQFVLASASPRRKKLLADAGYQFIVQPSNIDENTLAEKLEDLCPEKHTVQLALAKASNVAELYPASVTLGADTIVECKGKIIGKPRSRSHARQILKLLFSTPHRVITGLALVHKNKNITITRIDITKVFPRRITDTQIEDYLNTGKWQGKAGAYGIQQVKDDFIERLEGSFTNVIGLPLELTEQLLANLGITPKIKQNFNPDDPELSAL